MVPLLGVNSYWPFHLERLSRGRRAGSPLAVFVGEGLEGVLSRGLGKGGERGGWEGRPGSTTYSIQGGHHRGISRAI